MITKAHQAVEARMASIPLETAPTFTRTFTTPQIGLILDEDRDALGGRVLTRVKRVVPRSAAMLAGVPPGVAIVAINGKSTEWRRSYKEVKKLVQLAQRPVTIAFSAQADDELTFPPNDTPKPALPAYAMRPVG
jgi:predicted metalloprotease with PDZ domain